MYIQTIIFCIYNIRRKFKILNCICYILLNFTQLLCYNKSYLRISCNTLLSCSCIYLEIHFSEKNKGRNEKIETLWEISNSKIYIIHKINKFTKYNMSYGFNHFDQINDWFFNIFLFTILRRCLTFVNSLVQNIITKKWK